MGRDPFFHLDAYSASRSGSIDLSDYEALNPIFPLALRPRIGEGQRKMLWSLEGPDDKVANTLKWLNANLAVPIDFVVLVAEDSPVENSVACFAELTRQLDSGTCLFATSPGNFVRVYQRRARAF
jgi:hypothetical protein